MAINAASGKNKSSHKSVGGFIHNLANDARNALVGVVESPYYIGKAVTHDFNAGNADQTGAMLKGIIDSYTQMYGPLVHGHIGKFASNVYDHPIQPALDALTIATAGGAGAAKAAGLLAKGAESGGSAARIASRVGALEHISPEAFKALAPHEVKGAIRLADGSALVAGKHSIGGYYDRVLATNPVIRTRQLATEKLLAKYGKDTTIPGKLTSGYFGADRRGTRLHLKEQSRIVQRVRSQLLTHAAAAVHDLSPHEATAAAYRVIGFDNPTDYHALVSQRLNLIDELKAKPAKGNARLIAKLQTNLDTITKPEVRNLILQPSEAMTRAESHVHDVSQYTQVARAARGTSADTGPLTVDSRSAQPLRIAHGSRAEMQNFGDGADKMYLTPGNLEHVDPARRLAVMTMSEDRRIGRGGNAARGVRKGVYKSAEDMRSTGFAFQHALVEPDLRRILRSANNELTAVSTVERIKYIAQIARPIDSTDPAQAADLQSGALVAVNTEMPIAKQIGELSQFVNQHVSEVLGTDAKSQELGAMLAQWQKDIGDTGMAVPKVAMDELSRQVNEGFSLYRRILEKPTQLWRDFTLSLKGSFYVNNFIGNLLLGLVAHPLAFVPALVRHGFKDSSTLAKAVDKHAGDLIHSGQAETLAALAHDGKSYATRKWYNAPGRLGDFFAKHGARFTESNFRRASMAIEINQAARAVAKAHGLKHADAVNAILDNADSVDALAQKVYGDLLDYSKMTPFEKAYVRPLLPFWNFTRSIIGKTITLTLDEPWKVEVLKVMSETAQRENKHGLFANIKGDLPPYLQGLMKIGETKNGLTPVYSTYAANPFSATADTIDQAASLVTGDAANTQSPLAQVNPYIRSGLEAMTGRDLFFDKPLQGSRGHIFATQLANNFPQVATYTRVRYPGASPYLERTPLQSLAQYAGVPVASFNEQNANRNIAIAAYYDQLSKLQQEKYIAKRDSRDRGRLLGLAG